LYLFFPPFHVLRGTGNCGLEVFIILDVLSLLSIRVIMLGSKS